MKISLRKTCHKGSREIMRLLPRCLCTNSKSRALLAEVERAKDPELCPRGVRPPQRSETCPVLTSLEERCHVLLFLLQVSHGFVIIKFISSCWTCSHKLFLPLCKAAPGRSRSLPAVPRSEAAGRGLLRGEHTLQPLLPKEMPVISLLNAVWNWCVASCLSSSWRKQW